jgi:hypothetical protein
MEVKKVKGKTASKEAAEVYLAASTGGRDDRFI